MEYGISKTAAVDRDRSIWCHYVRVRARSRARAHILLFAGLAGDGSMDLGKCKALKARLGPDLYGQIVPIAEYFDGNDDLGSIGCNLAPHPGIARFREVLTGLLKRPDVQAVYAQISELDPGEESWPFADTVLVAGKITADNLRSVVNPLQPDCQKPYFFTKRFFYPDINSTLLCPTGSKLR